MRTFSRILAALLILVMCVAVLPAAAVTVSDDGLEVTLKADKSSYKKDEPITATLTVINHGNQTVYNVSLENVVPTGYRLKNGEKSVLKVKELAPDETVTLKVTFVPQKPAASSPETGDNAAMMPVLALLLVSAAGLFAMVTMGRRMKRIVCLVLCVSMLVSVFAGIPMGAKAAEAVKKTLEIKEVVKVSAKDFTLKAKVSYELPEAAEPTEPDEPTEPAAATEPSDAAEPTDATEPAATVYAVSFVSNGGSVVETQYVEEGNTAARPDDPTQDGYVFMGWYSDEELTVLYDFTAPVTADLTLYADWEEERISETADADADNVPDYLESLYGSSTQSQDSDDDGLSDYIEIFRTATNPVLADTDGDGVADGDEDTDQDGLTNLREIALGTDLAKADTDGDGLTDGAEINVYQTNPLSWDTDADGAGDGLEISLNTNPLAADVSFAISRTAENNADTVNVTVNATLSGAQAQTVAVKAVNNDFLFPSNMPGYMGKAYMLRVEGEPEAAVITFAFDASGLDGGAQPVIFRYDERTHQLLEVETTVEGSTASAAAVPDSAYILLDKTAFCGARRWEEAWEITKPVSGVELVLMVDGSADMAAMDLESLRLEAARNLIDRLPQGSKAEMIEVGGELTICEAAAEEENVEAVQINGVPEETEAAVEQQRAKSGMSLFADPQEDVLKVLVVLSGESADAALYTAALTEAAEKNARIYAVGLGGDNAFFAEYLKPMAETTGGAFVQAAEAVELEAIFGKISKQIDLKLDTDGDGIANYYEDNMYGANGVRIPLDKYNADTDGDGLSDGKELNCEVIYSADRTQAYIVGLTATQPAAADSDYDGKPDSSDKAPSNNKFTGKLISNFATSSITTYMDYRWFFGDNTVYNKNLSIMSSLFSAVMYEGTSLSLSDSANSEKTDGKTIQQIMTYFGMSNPKSYSLNSMYSDDHLSEVALGYRTVKYNNKQKTILAVIIRGTNGTLQEWTSNFDVGQLSTDTSSDDWKNTKNHKGFDITANRIMKLVDQYISENGISKSSVVYWVTGHSRGAAVANIIGANLEKAGKTAFTYTFAAPNTTMAADAKSYKSIFNIINEDDFVPCLPMASWGYTRYGRSTKAVSVAKSYESNWEKTTGIWDYNPDTLGMQDSVAQMSKILQTGKDPRVGLYTYTCDCSYSNHKGDKSLDTITHTFSLSSTKNRTKEINKIPVNAMPYCFIRQYKSGIINPYKYDQCQTPAYFMQLLAAMMGGEINAYRFAVELNIAKRYESAKTALVSAYLGGIEHPHYPETYYVLANNIAASVFE